jgi:hypothetical protein
MNPGQPETNGNICGGNVVPFRPRAASRRHCRGDQRGDNILRLLDLAKFERPRAGVEHDASLRVNIAAMVLLGILVFAAAEDFSRLELLNACAERVDCRN